MVRPSAAGKGRRRGLSRTRLHLIHSRARVGPLGVLSSASMPSKRDVLALVSRDELLAVGGDLDFERPIDPDPVGRDRP